MSRAKTQLWAAAVASHISSLAPFSSFIMQYFGAAYLRIQKHQTINQSYL
jgi:hypothetical protein